MARTSWWWVRHAPVTSDGGRVYGAGDPPADCSDTDTFAWLARLLPGGAVWLTSALARTHQTADGVFSAGYGARAREVEADLGEQHFGDLQGTDRRSAFATHTPGRHRLWLSGVETPAPGGESFRDLIARVAPVIERRTDAHRGSDIVCVAHGGTIRAALAHAGVDPTMALSMEVSNLSVTRLDHLPAAGAWPAQWAICFVNRLPL